VLKKKSSLECLFRDFGLFEVDTMEKYPTSLFPFFSPWEMGTLKKEGGSNILPFKKNLFHVSKQHFLFYIFISLQSMTMLLHFQRVILALYCFNTIKLECSQGM